MIKCSIESEKNIKVRYFHIGNPPKLVSHLDFQMQPEIHVDRKVCPCFIRYHWYHDVSRALQIQLFFDENENIAG